ncbi:TULIP family P47-like protein [Peribacillus muralis]|uniref:TULIP family P47-like protein n=1 Tax=Peribacillus muralis TaxID=264697 RepID=UPI003D0305DB
MMHQTKKLNEFRIYDWNKTIQEASKKKMEINESIPKMFFYKLKDENMMMKVKGTWKEWKLTNEGHGKRPVLTCYIDDGSFEVKQKDTVTVYPLKNTWVKICTQIGTKADETNQVDSFVDTESTLFITNSSFNLKEDERLLSTAVENLLINWFRKNSDSLDTFMTKHQISSYSQDDVSLLGWDTTFATSFTQVNNNINQHNLFPNSFEELNAEMGLMMMMGTFGAWELTTGGGGQNVQFKCPIWEGSFSRNNNTVNFSDQDFIKIQLKLNYVNNLVKDFQDPTSIGSGEQVDLKVKATEGEDNQLPVVIISSQFLNVNPNSIDKALIEFMFGNWLNDNIYQFNQIFVSLLLGETSKTEGFQWVKPTTAYYGVAEVENDLDRSVFGVMSMVEGRENKQPSHSVDPRLLSAANNEAAFAISTELFAEKWLYDSLIAMQIGTSDQFERSDNGRYYTNKERLMFGMVEDDDGNPVESFIEPKNFRMGITNNQLHIKMDHLSWEQKRGITGILDYEQYYDLKLASGTDELGKEYKNVLIPIEAENQTAVLDITFEEADWHRHEATLISVGTAVGVSVLFCFIPFGKILQPLKNVVGSAFKKVGSKMVARLGRTGTSGSGEAGILLRNIVAGEAEAGAAAAQNFRRLSMSSADEVSLLGHQSAAQALNTVRNQSLPIFERMWKMTLKHKGTLSTVGSRGFAGITGGFIGYEMADIIQKAIVALDEQHYSVLPTIDNFVSNCVGTVKWPDKDFSLESAGLYGVYLMGGKLV